MGIGYFAEASHSKKWRRKALFACIIIHTFQLVFPDETVFFSHAKSIRTVFRLIFSAKRTGPLYTEEKINYYSVSNSNLF